MQVRFSEDRVVPIGIEIEVPWKAYFPDLWVEGFPNIHPDLLAEISEACSVREKVLLSRLQETVELGINKGADKYWEFAFDPVTEVGITHSHVMMLQLEGLIPPGPHSLHITLGGLKLDRNCHYIAMILESMSCSPSRIMTGFHPTSSAQSTGWARKGYAGMFLKEGNHDLQHGYEVGTEIRILQLPETELKLFELLDVAQQLACMVALEQRGQKCVLWQQIVIKCRDVLAQHNLPDQNWKKPHIEPNVWRGFATQYEFISSCVINTVLPLIVEQEWV